MVQVYAGMHPERVARLIVEDVGPERTNDIASAFTRQVQNEANGWASEDELIASLKKSNAKRALRVSWAGRDCRHHRRPYGQ